MGENAFHMVFQERWVFSHSSSNPVLAATRLWAGYGELMRENSISPGNWCVLSEVVEVCNAEDHRVSCAREQIIVVTSAEFGRMSVGRCITEADDFMGCSNDVLPLLDRWCSGRQECNFEVTNNELDAANQNCMKILIKYLTFEYECISGN